MKQEGGATSSVEQGATATPSAKQGGRAMSSADQLGRAIPEGQLDGEDQGIAVSMVYVKLSAMFIVEDTEADFYYAQCKTTSTSQCKKKQNVKVKKNTVYEQDYGRHSNKHTKSQLKVTETQGLVKQDT